MPNSQIGPVGSKDITRSNVHGLHALSRGETDHMWLIKINYDWLKN